MFAQTDTNLRKLFLITLLLALGIVPTRSGFCCAGESKRKIEIEIAGKKYPLVFENGISLRQKKFIATDIEAAFSPVKEIKLKKQQNVESVVTIGKTKALTFNYHLIPTEPSQKSIEGSDGILPPLLKRQFGTAIKIENNYLLLVNTKLIENYEHMMELGEKSPALFSGIDEFINLLNDQKQIAQLVQDEEFCRKHVFMGNGMKINYAMAFIRNHLADAHVFKPSVFDIKSLKTVDFSYLPENGYLMTVAAKKSHEKGAPEEYWRAQLGLYTEANQNWRIIIYPMP